MTEERAQEQELRMKLKTAQKAYEPYWNYQMIIESYETEKNSLETNIAELEEVKHTSEEQINKEVYEDFSEYVSDEDKKKIEAAETSVEQAKKDFHDLVTSELHKKLFNEQNEVLEQLAEINAEIKKVSSALNSSIQKEVNEEDYEKRMKLKEETELFTEELNNLNEQKNEIVRHQNDLAGSIKSLKNKSEQASKTIRNRLADLESSKELVINRIKKNLTVTVKKSDNKIAELYTQLQTLDAQKKNEYKAAVEMVEIDAQHIQDLKTRIENLCNELGKPVTYTDVPEEEIEKTVVNIENEQEQEFAPELDYQFMEQINASINGDLTAAPVEEQEESVEEVAEEVETVGFKIKSFGSRVIKCVTKAIKNTYTKTIDLIMEPVEEEVTMEFPESEAVVNETNVSNQIQEQNVPETEVSYDEPVAEEPAPEVAEPAIEQSQEEPVEEAHEEKVNDHYALNGAKKSKMPKKQASRIYNLSDMPALWGEAKQALENLKQEAEEKGVNLEKVWPNEKTL